MQSLVDNKKARFNYETQDKFEAGIELLGLEVKSIKNHQGSLEGAFVIIRGGEAYLINAHIPPYQAQNTPESYDPDRNRRLLLTKKEIAELAGLGEDKGLTIVPLSMYNKANKIKVAVATVRGKKKYDKRESIRKKETGRELRRRMKER
jgi:SsrA-binding protein